MDALVAAILKYTEEQVGESPFVTPVEGLTILRSDRVKPITHLIYKPALCIVVQGAKWAMFGSTRLEYGAGQALVVDIEMPGMGRVVEASPGKPYLGVIVEFDLAIMHEIAVQMSGRVTSRAGASARIFVLDIDERLADCVLRLVRLLQTPEAIPVLYPLIMREMSYWLLSGRHGSEIAGIGYAKGHPQPIIKAIHSLRDRFREPVRIEELAQIARLSLSSFHRQFKSVTLMTPLQYQKQLRLLEARRLLMLDAVSVETAAFEVGYESPSQFSREYSRTFGTPPRRDVSHHRSSG
jgi:AraC-like DNA-binding protein